MRFLVAVLVPLFLVPPALGAQAQCPSPAPPSGLDPTSLADRQAVLAYARSLQFHPASSPTGETRPLTTISTPGNRDQRRFRLAADAAIQPQVCSHRNTNADIGRGAGRIVARHTLSAAYDKLQLPAGVSYMWIDNLDADAARGVIIPDDLTTSSRVVALRVEFHPDLPSRGFAEARWVFNPDDDDAWYYCVITGCCILPGGP